MLTVEAIMSDKLVHRYSAVDRSTLFVLLWAFDKCEDIFQYRVFENNSLSINKNFGWRLSSKWVVDFDFSHKNKFYVVLETERHMNIKSKELRQFIGHEVLIFRHNIVHPIRCKVIEIIRKNIITDVDTFYSADIKSIELYRPETNT